MAFTIKMRMKKPGRQMTKDLPLTSLVLEEKPQTVRELLLGLTEIGVRNYNARKDEGQLLPFLTRKQITDQAARGKISFGVHGGGEAELKDALENTIQCFEDGIYRVFAGTTELAELDGKIPWEEDPVFTLIRLTMLSG